MTAYRTFRPSGAGFGNAFATPPPRDLVALLAFVFATFAMQFFAASAPLIDLLRLGAEVWERAWVWQLATFAFTGFGPASVWILLELLILYWFARDVRDRLGARRFWSLMLLAGIASGSAAVAVEMLTEALAGGYVSPAAFTLMQGQRTLLAVAIAAFASLNADATILLFFVLPVRARAFVWLSLLLAFIGFLAVKDLAGLAGIAVATGIGYWRATGRGGPRLRLRIERARLRWRLWRLRRRSGLRVVDERRGKGPTIN